MAEARAFTLIVVEAPRCFERALISCSSYSASCSKHSAWSIIITYRCSLISPAR